MFEKKFVSFLSDDGFPRGFRARVRVSVYESYLSIYCVHISCEGRKKDRSRECVTSPHFGV